MKQTWTPGTPPAPIEPDRLFAVLAGPVNAGYAVGTVIRGEDCNWRSSTIVAHYPLSFTMNSAEARRLQRTGEYSIPPAVADPLQELLDYLRDERPCFASDLDAGHDLLATFDGHFVAWDEIIEQLKGSLDDLGYGESPAELITRLIDERDDLRQKVSGHQALLQQIMTNIPSSINAEGFDYNAASPAEEALSGIDMLIGTFGDKPEEIAPQCKNCGYEGENKDLKLQLQWATRARDEETIKLRACRDNALPRPMAEAPRDGSEILAYHIDGKTYHPVAWRDGYWHMRWNDEYCCGDGFYSGWLPYPTKEATSGG